MWEPCCGRMAPGAKQTVTLGKHHPFLLQFFQKQHLQSKDPGCANPERARLLTGTCQPELPFTLLCFSLGPFCSLLLNHIGKETLHTQFLFWTLTTYNAKINLDISYLRNVFSKSVRVITTAWKPSRGGLHVPRAHCLSSIMHPQTTYSAVQRWLELFLKGTYLS